MQAAKNHGYARRQGAGVGTGRGAIVATKTLDQQHLIQQPITNDLIPKEGPRAIPVILDFTAYDSYVFDYQNMSERGFISMVQTVFIDNRANSLPVTVTMNKSNQVIIAKPYTQGYYAILMPNPIKVTFTCAGGPAGLIVFLINTQMTSAVWSAVGSGTVTVASQEYVMGSGGLVIPALVANYTISPAAGITATAAAIVTGAPGYYINGFTVALSSDATFATSDLLVSLVDSVSGQIASVVLNAAMRAGATGLFWNNKTAASSLAFTLSTAILTGKLYYTVPYGILSLVG